MVTYRTSRSRSAGFTLLELTVSLGVAAIMLFLIDRIFFETQRAVTAGIKTGEIMVKAETIGTQIQRDAELMMGPASSGGNRGCLIIAHKIYQNIRVLDPNFVSPDPNNPQPLTENIRSDQLVFFIDGGATDGLKSITPQTANTLSSTRAAQYARVWYGHVLLTKPDGTIDAGDTLANGNAQNLFGNRWAAGRQALLFAPYSGYTLSGSDVYSSYTVSPGVVKPSTNVSLNGYTSSFPYQGKTDLCFHDLIDVWTNVTTYPDDALGFSYLDNRLQANQAPSGRTFTAEVMSQLHPLLATNVSDFIVEFAGDYEKNTPPATIEPDGLVDAYTSGGQERIKWYGYYFNNSVDGILNADGSVSSYDANQPTVFRVPTTVSNFVSAATVGTNECYYLASSTSPALTGAPNADAVFIFRHDDNTATNLSALPPVSSKWPYLLRIRYRLHDDNGVIAGTNTAGQRSTGKWYEHIIRVPRP